MSSSQWGRTSQSEPGAPSSQWGRKSQSGWGGAAMAPGAWGNLNNGMTKAEVTRMLGKPSATDATNPKSVKYLYPQGASVTFDSTGRVFRWQRPSASPDKSVQPWNKQSNGWGTSAQDRNTQPRSWGMPAQNQNIRTHSWSTPAQSRNAPPKSWSAQPQSRSGQSQSWGSPAQNQNIQPQGSQNKQSQGWNAQQRDRGRNWNQSSQSWEDTWDEP